VKEDFRTIHASGDIEQPRQLVEKKKKEEVEMKGHKRTKRKKTDENRNEAEKSMVLSSMEEGALGNFEEEKKQKGGDHYLSRIERKAQMKSRINSKQKQTTTLATKDQQATLIAGGTIQEDSLDPNDKLQE